MHAPVPHETRQLTDAVQSTPLLHVSAAHVTLHGPAPHTMSELHAVVPVHSMSQRDAWLQSMPERQPRSPQTT